MEISESNRSQLATLQSGQNTNRTQATDNVQRQTSNENQQQTLRANEGNSSVNISSEAQRLLASEQAQSNTADSPRTLPTNETAELQSGGTQSGKPR